ncbi:hypothetical protein M2137_001638 [Parabacteroides sp. PFB2-10]|uniref:hypothetical protein n=1 Tax=Parabacteroides sp. PFB2-10 TaxID=1742405 RepID=UPI002475426E|nr:hypothetical protein [Parabacteroides sp. PFB2-10]MDH6312853.1 hypothetical protein [Parabacteroides sp. PFB2-10]
MAVGDKKGEDEKIYQLAKADLQRGKKLKIQGISDQYLKAPLLRKEGGGRCLQRWGNLNSL